MLAIEKPATLQDAVDRANYGRIGDPAFQQGAVNGNGTVFTQVAGSAELTAQVHDQFLESGRSALRRTARSRSSVGPIDAVEALVASALDPLLESRKADAELACGLT